MEAKLANTLLNPDMITNETLRILHQKLNFIGTINRAYDDSFAKSGAKIGSDLRIRLPNQYTVTDGAVLSVQETTEENVTLQVTTQKHVGMRFSSEELTLDIDRFSERYIEPAASVLAAKIEADAMSMYKDVYNQSNQGTLTAALDIDTVLEAKRLLDESLAPNSPVRTANLCPRQAVNLVSGLKGLFHDSTQISKQYLEGEMGTTAGFKFVQNSLWQRHTSGSDDGNDYTVNGATESGSAVTVATGTGTFLKGDIITFAGCFRVHPETKASSGELQQFTVTADYVGGAGDVSISPSIVISGAKQNVSGYPTNGGTVTKVGGVSKAYDLGMTYHKDAFTFATADLVMPSGVDFSSRKVLDGISLRVVRQYDINNDNLPCRIDVLYGYKTIRPQLACRLASKSDA
jgi:hypothetical protein